MIHTRIPYPDVTPAHEAALSLASDIQDALDEAGGGHRVEVVPIDWGTREELWVVLVGGKAVESVGESLLCLEESL